MLSIISRIFLILLAFVLPLNFLFSQYTEVINSNRPSQSMGAFSVGKKVYQFEQGISFRRGNFNKLYNSSFSGIGTNIQIRVGSLRDNLEFIGSLDFQMDNLIYQNQLGKISKKRNGFDEIALGAKYLIYDPFRKVDKYKVNIYSWRANNKFRFRDLVPAISIYGGLQFKSGVVYPYQEKFYELFNFNYRTLEEPFISGSTLLIFQQHILPGFVITHNLGLKYLLSDYMQTKIIGTLTYSTNPKLSFFGEYVYDNSNLHNDITIASGAAYLINKSLQIDFATSYSIKNTPRLFSAGLGFSYRLDKYNIYEAGPQDLAEMKLIRKEERRERKAKKNLLKEKRKSEKTAKKLERKQRKIQKKISRKND